MRPKRRVARERKITRAQAIEFLDRVPETQRTLNLDTAKRYALDMKAGKWIPGVAHIAFDRKGKLINGQHVLNALVLSELPELTVIVSFNHESDAYAGFDKNRKRSAKDDLRTQGLDHAGEIASVATVIWQWEKGCFKGTSYTAARKGTDFPTSAQVCETVRMHPGIQSHLIKNPFRGTGCSIGALRAASYILHALDERKAKAFFASLLEGIEIPTRDHPIAVLRNRFLNLGGKERMRNGETLAAIFKAWDCYVRKELISGPLLRKGELFPELRAPGQLKSMQKRA